MGNTHGCSIVGLRLYAYMLAKVYGQHDVNWKAEIGWAQKCGAITYKLLKIFFSEDFL